MRGPLVFLLLCSAAAAADRVSMVDNSGQNSVKDSVAQAARAFDGEDLDSYESCFKESRRQAVRRRAALLFADEDCSMELLDIHVIEEDGDSASAAVKYRMAGSYASYTILSEVSLVNEEGRWRIDRETVRSKSRTSLVSDSHASARPPAAWDPMNPDPNRIPKHLHHLIGDVGIQEGFGCAGGRCANGRCER